MKEENDPIRELLERPPVVVNLGLRIFAESLEVQGVDVVHIDWTPPAGGDQEMIDLLDRLL